MNKIEARVKGSEFVSDPHLVILIDGSSLDSMLATHWPDRQFNGLVPTLLGWLNDDRERAIVWQRILPTDEVRSVAPILMCPDDLDFWCTIVVADITANSNTVRWHRLGVDRSSPEDLPDSIGSNVDWLDGIGNFEFDRLEYSEMLAEFRGTHKPRNTA
jgi:hypothetical protein